MADNVITQKVGPLPLVVWVAGGAGVIAIFILMSHKGNNGASGNQTNSVSALAPTEAEAFGTLEQQQQDVTNALTTLGNNQAALGGSMSTLTGIVTQQGTDNASAFQSIKDNQDQLLQGQTDIKSGQAAAATSANNYYQGLLANMLNYFNSLYSQGQGISGQIAGVSGQVGGVQSSVNGLNSSTGQYYAALQQQISGVSGQVSTVGNQVSGLWAPDMNIVERLSTLSNQLGFGPGH